MNAALFLLAGGLFLGVTGSFIAARLLRLDRFWSPRSGDDLSELLADLRLIARLRASDQPGALASVTLKSDHAILTAGLALLTQGRNAIRIRTDLSALLVRKSRTDAKLRAIGRGLSYAAPIIALGTVAVAMFLALQSIADPTSASAGSAIALMVLIVAGPIMNAITRRFPKHSPNEIAQGELVATALLEGLCIAATGAGADASENAARDVLGPLAPETRFASAA